MKKAILFSLDGDYVTDFESKTKEEVIEKLTDRGSRWYFYPIEGIINASRCKDFLRKRVIMEWMPELNGKTVKTISKYYKEARNEIKSKRQSK
jgi:hypothetical protein